MGGFAVWIPSHRKLPRTLPTLSRGPPIFLNTIGLEMDRLLLDDLATDDTRLECWAESDTVMEG